MTGLTSHQDRQSLVSFSYQKATDRKAAHCCYWTEAEDDIVRLHYGDRATLLTMLPHRTNVAITHRAIRLRIAKQKQINTLTAKDVKIMRQMAPTATTYYEIAAAIGKSYRSVGGYMMRHGIKLAQRPLVITGIPLVDEIRQKIRDRGMTLLDFDRSLGYRSRHFSKSNNSGKISPGQIQHAVKALGGRLVIFWDDEGNSHD